MNCHDCERLVHAWADGELDPVATADLETHLNDCSPCAARAEAIAALGASVRAAPLYAAAPRGLEGRVRSVLRREAGVAPWKLAIGRWGAIAAAVLLAGSSAGRCRTSTTISSRSPPRCSPRICGHSWPVTCWTCPR